MKRRLLIVGIFLSFLGAAWLVYIARRPLPSDGVDRYFTVRANRGEATMAFVVFFGGIGLILADAFVYNPKAERQEAKRRALQQAILDLLPLARESQKDLNTYIKEVYDRTGLFWLDV